jgi:hypothetical protein
MGSEGGRRVVARVSDGCRAAENFNCPKIAPELWCRFTTRRGAHSRAVQPLAQRRSCAASSRKMG